MGGGGGATLRAILTVCTFFMFGTLPVVKDAQTNGILAMKLQQNVENEALYGL